MEWELIDSLPIQTTVCNSQTEVTLEVIVMGARNLQVLLYITEVQNHTRIHTSYDTISGWASTYTGRVFKPIFDIIFEA